MTTTSQHLTSASVQLQIASSALISARRHLTEAGFGEHCDYLADLAASMFDTAHDLAHHTQHPED